VAKRCATKRRLGVPQESRLPTDWQRRRERLSKSHRKHWHPSDAANYKPGFNRNGNKEVLVNKFTIKRGSSCYMDSGSGRCAFANYFNHLCVAHSKM
jgi:hypothetical protein